MKLILITLATIFFTIHTYGQTVPIENDKSFVPEVPKGVLTNDDPLPGAPQTSNPFKETNHPSFRQPVEQKSAPTEIGGDIEGTMQQLEQSKQEYYSTPVKQVPVQEIVLPDNIDRFTTSPCYEQIGYRPGADPQVMEKVYSDCEKGKKNQEVKGISTVVVLISAVVALVIMGVLVTKRKS